MILTTDSKQVGNLATRKSVTGREKFCLGHCVPDGKCLNITVRLRDGQKTISFYNSSRRAWSVHWKQMSRIATNR